MFQKNSYVSVIKECPMTGEKEEVCVFLDEEGIGQGEVAALFENELVLMVQKKINKEQESGWLVYSEHKPTANIFSKGNVVKVSQEKKEMIIEIDFDFVTSEYLESIIGCFTAIEKAQRVIGVEVVKLSDMAKVERVLKTITCTNCGEEYEEDKLPMIHEEDGYYYGCSLCFGKEFE